MDILLLGIFQLILIQAYIIWKLYNKTKWWEETYHKTKRAHSDIIKRYVFDGS
jgi:hypothetical protein